MALIDPIAAYTASSNLEAHLVCSFLVDSGIEAAVVEDVAATTGWMGGLLSQIHKPQVWVERTELERATSLLQVYERQAANRRAVENAPSLSGSMIEVVCDSCKHRSEFAGSQNGSVQNCPHCGAFVDVGNPHTAEGLSDATDEEAAD